MYEDDDDIDWDLPPDFDPEDMVFVRSCTSKIRYRFRKESQVIDESEHLKMVQAALRSVKPLQISTEPELYRYLSLSVRLRPEQKQSRFLSQIFARIIGNIDWTANMRLNFIEKHIVGREPPEHEPDFGDPFRYV